MSLQRKLSFIDSDSLKTNTKGSLFEKLFPLRKGLFEKFPSANKGLAFSGPGINFGTNGTFTFVSSEKSDKVDYKGNDGLIFTARCKRDAKLFDLVLKGKCDFMDGLSYLVKYEERKEAAPRYVIGGEFTCSKTGFQETFKLDPLTTAAKISLLQVGGKCGIPEGLRFAADTKLFLNQLSKPEHILFNVGLAYKNSLGQTGVSYNQKSELTITCINQFCDGKLSAGVELGYSISGGDKKSPKMPLVVAASYQLDKTTLIRAKINKDFALNFGVRKDYSKNLSVTAGTMVDLSKTPTPQVPAFGFKVTMKA
eukprot:GEMP01051242.1.p1 GENE.GEMP01051242.1~~GEMP01051242.1.p1  ORF type:complete len:326 (-),score=47.50 GEMP01051242.1:649-1578(-)